MGQVIEVFRFGELTFLSTDDLQETSGMRRFSPVQAKKPFRMRGFFLQDTDGDGGRIAGDDGLLINDRLNFLVNTPLDRQIFDGALYDDPARFKLTVICCDDEVPFKSAGSTSVSPS